MNELEGKYLFGIELKYKKNHLTRTSPSGEIALLPAELKETVSY
jgi:hypothetical protein